METVKKLRMKFNAEGGASFTLSLHDPKDGLTLAQAQAAAESIIPVMVSAAGNALESLEGADVVTTTVEALV